MDIKKNPYICCLLETCFGSKVTLRLKGDGKRYSKKIEIKKSILMSNETNKDWHK